MTHRAKVIAGGKIAIPAGLRREFGIQPGESLLIERDGSGAMVLKTQAQVADEDQAAVRAMRNPGVDYSGAIDELLAERRAGSDANMACRCFPEIGCGHLDLGVEDRLIR